MQLNMKTGPEIKGTGRPGDIKDPEYSKERKQQQTQRSEPGAHSHFKERCLDKASRGGMGFGPSTHQIEMGGTL